MIFNKNDVVASNECGFQKNEINRFCEVFENILIEQNEDYLEDFKNEEESVLEQILNRYLEAYFSTMFENVTHERSLIFLLSLTDPDVTFSLEFSKSVEKIFRKETMFAVVLFQRHRISDKLASCIKQVCGYNAIR